MFSTVKLYLTRNKFKTVSIILIVAIVMFVELIGLLLLSTSERAEKDAFNYNGAAVIIESENGILKKSQFEKIKNIEHVAGLGGWKETIVDPLDSVNVKEHIGITPQEDDGRSYADKMVVVAHMNVEKHKMFRWEKNVSVIKGAYPNVNNKGILIESRYAAINDINVGDSLTYMITETGKEIKVKVCGVYRVDSDFEILDDNEAGTSVYIYSPYNVIYIDYDTWIEMSGLDYNAAYASEIYVDDISNVEYVKEALNKLFGDEINIVDNSEIFLSSECKIVTLMAKASKLICWMTFVLGGIIILFIFSFYEAEYQKENGLFLILGRSKNWCIRRWAYICLSYIGGGILFSITTFGITGNWICKIIETKSKAIIDNSILVIGGGCRTPGINRGFEVAISPEMIVSSRNIIVLLAFMVSIYLIILIFPLIATKRCSERKLLNSRG